MMMHHVVLALVSGASALQLPSFGALPSPPSVPSLDLRGLSLPSVSVPSVSLPSLGDGLSFPQVPQLPDGSVVGLTDRLGAELAGALGGDWTPYATTVVGSACATLAAALPLIALNGQAVGGLTARHLPGRHDTCLSSASF